METMDLNGAFWRNRRVLITGHTGFKGGWLSIWLSGLGARVHGFALPPPTSPSLFETASILKLLQTHTLGDVRDLAALRSAVDECDPEIVFHLAAQPLVRESYAAPLDTFSINVIGTANLLESLRNKASLIAVVNVTTDKCYENREWHWGYREIEPLGGRDPYSSSKACAELVTAAYRQSFFGSSRISIATARAGNVIGGGDWARDRLVPDFFRATAAGEPLAVRHPAAVRPWQHVLEPLAGYISLAEGLAHERAFAEAWNFGPNDEDCLPVSMVLDYLSSRTPGSSWKHVAGHSVHEALVLKLDSSKARNKLGWSPRWRIGDALEKTLSWQHSWLNRENMLNVCESQIEAYMAARQ